MIIAMQNRREFMDEHDPVHVYDDTTVVLGRSYSCSPNSLRRIHSLSKFELPSAAWQFGVARQ